MNIKTDLIWTVNPCYVSNKTGHLLYVEVMAGQYPAATVDRDYACKLKSGLRCLPPTHQILMTSDCGIHWSKLSAIMLYKVRLRMTSVKIKNWPVYAVLYELLKGAS